MTDPAVVVSFPLVEDPNVHLLAWTTTPWTLPSHTGLAVHPDFEYIKIHDEKSGKVFVILEQLLSTLYKDPKKAKYSVVGKVKGKDMLGWQYKPLFDYFYEDFKDSGFRVLNGTYVTADSGTGIVHQAPAFGEEDYQCCRCRWSYREKRPPPDPLDDTGHFTEKGSRLCWHACQTSGQAHHQALESLPIAWLSSHNCDIHIQCVLDRILPLFTAQCLPGSLEFLKSSPICLKI